MYKRSGKSIYCLAFALFLGGVGYLIYSGLSDDSVYFLNVNEALAKAPTELRSARLFGSVAPVDIVRHQNGFGVSFMLQDKDNIQQALLVEYKGAVPDTFEAGAEVIVEGGLSPEGHFQATSLMTKCPSKYQKENRS